MVSINKQLAPLGKKPRDKWIFEIWTGNLCWNQTERINLPFHVVDSWNRNHPKLQNSAKPTTDIYYIYLETGKKWLLGPTWAKKLGAILKAHIGLLPKIKDPRSILPMDRNKTEVSKAIPKFSKIFLPPATISAHRNKDCNFPVT